jgi:hypothetical protein
MLTKIRVTPTIDIVLVPCLKCGTMLNCVFEPGEPPTRDHPGEPDWWYSTNESDTCDHEGTYTKEELDTFFQQCYAVASESFEYLPDY